MDHFRKSLDPVEMCVRDSEFDKRRVQYRDGATKSIMTWIQGVLTSIRREIGPCGHLGNFLVRRARVRDDSGRSPQIELDPERSFDGALSRQSVYEQTSGNLRHTESVQNDKVQKRDWRQKLEQVSRATTRPPKRPTSLHSLTLCQTARVSVIFVSRRSGQSQTSEAMTQ